MACVMDLASRRIVGWSMSDRLKADLVCQALKSAYWRRKPPAGLIMHSDRGSQGEFNWSSQHLDDEVLRCRNGNGDGQTGRVDLRCVRLAGRR